VGAGQGEAHSQLVAALTGDSAGAAVLVDDKVDVNLGPLIAKVKERLLQQGFTLADRIPPVDRRSPSSGRRTSRRRERCSTS
jgi:hypothetical protein